MSDSTGLFIKMHFPRSHHEAWESTIFTSFPGDFYALMSWRTWLQAFKSPKILLVFLHFCLELNSEKWLRNSILIIICWLSRGKDWRNYLSWGPINLFLFGFNYPDIFCHFYPWKLNISTTLQRWNRVCFLICHNREFCPWRRVFHQKSHI